MCLTPMATMDSNTFLMMVVALHFMWDSPTVYIKNFNPNENYCRSLIYWLLPTDRFFKKSSVY